MNICNFIFVVYNLLKHIYIVAFENHTFFILTPKRIIDKNTYFIGHYITKYRIFVVG